MPAVLSDIFQPGGGMGMVDPLASETEEERRKRLLAQQQSRLLPATGYAGISSLGMTPTGMTATSFKGR